MRILDRYILKEFLKYFLGAIVTLLVIIIVADIFELMDVIFTNKVPILTASGYFVYQIPLWITQVSPVACLIGVLFSLGQIVKNNELTAMKASGMHLYRIVAPLIIFALFISFFFILINETVVPYTTSKAQRYRQEGIYLRPPDSKVTRENITLYGSNRQIYRIDGFNGKNNSMHGIFIDTFSKDSILKSTLYAKRALWKHGQWLFSEGVIRKFDKTGKNEISVEKFYEKSLFTGEIPGDFAKSERKPSEMNYRELKNYIKKLEDNGFKAHRAKVDLHMKLSFPFANFIILILGIPFALFGGHTKKALGVGIAIVVSFTYWGLMNIGHALGSNGKLTPLVAAWIVNILFLTFAGVLFLKSNK
ncbi:MAG: LPS export ABC transporter permease LptG [bacterium]